MIFLDLETSGLDPVKHGILSIGAVDSNRKGDESYFYAVPRLERGKEIDPGALEVNGFKMHELRHPEKKPLRYVLEKFMAWVNTVGEINLAGQNPSFDAGFLMNGLEETGITVKRGLKKEEIEAELKKGKIKWPFGHRYIDLFTTAINTYHRAGIKIPRYKGRYDIDFDAILWSVGLPVREGFHNALEDALLSAEAYSRLVYEKKLIEALRGYDLIDVRGFEGYKPKY